MSQKQHPTLNRSILMNPSARSRLFKENLGRGPQRLRNAQVGPLSVALCLVILMGVTAIASEEPRQPRPPIIKPTKTVVNPAFHRVEKVTVKFQDGMAVRLRDGALAGLDAEASRRVPDLSSGFAGGRWERAYGLAEEKLDELRRTAEANLGKAVADLNLQFNLTLPEGVDAGQVIDTLNALDCVEIALPMPLPMVPPTPSNFQPMQGYLYSAPGGIDGTCMWQLWGGTGFWSAVADIEYSWNLNHQDLNSATLLGSTPVDPFNDDNHGTAVLGEIGSVWNGWGTTGIAFMSPLYVVAANTASGYDIGSAVTTALGTLTAGDVILIEQQIAGPNYQGPGSQFGLVPVEWYLPYYNAIVTAVGNGVVVVEAAGNGSQNLDDPVYSTGNGGHWPFLPANDSGAIIVGAGASPGGSDTDRSRLSFSNYGSTLDLQGWGENIVTTGYGSYYSTDGKDLWYTATFGGTSSASPIVAGACAGLQSAYLAGIGSYLTPAQVRSCLQITGSPQQAGTYPVSQNIGPRPNAPAALCNAFPAFDSNANLVPDRCDGLPGIEACCFFFTGACVDTTPSNCLAYGGSPGGAGSGCPCLFVAEACCFPDGSCSDLGAAQCTAFGGTPQGPGTACATTACQAVEACCFPGTIPTCVDALPTNCQMSGGLPQGPGTTCATTQCLPSCPKFSQPPTSDHEDIPSDIDLVNMMPNVVVADDFQSDGRPITVVRWWGSYFDTRYKPVAYGGLGTPFQIDGWLISFHEPLTVVSPVQPALGLYFAPAANVSIMPTTIQSCDGHTVFEYMVETRRCCLMSFMPDSRSGWIPAQIEAFEEEYCFVYDIDIQAVVGMTYQRDPQTGMCLQIASQNISPGYDFWGWHATGIENGFRQALMSLTTPGPVGGPWLYGPWTNVMPFCGTPPVNMAFELLTSDPNVPPPCTVACCFWDGNCTDMLEADCLTAGGESEGPGSNCATAVCEIVTPKFVQQVTAGRETHPSDLDMQGGVPNVVHADDFQSDGRPITRVQWWGSYLDSRYRPVEFGGQGAPYQIDGWLISFHEPLTDNPPQPPQPALALYFVRAEEVLIKQKFIPRCDGHQVDEYLARLSKGCLIYAQPDSRSGLIPGQPDAFHEEHCFWYDIDIQALVGRTYYRDPQTGSCIEWSTQNHGPGADFWGWHTTGLENGRRAALVSQTAPGPVGAPWIYGPWSPAVPICSPPPVNMAFALLTNDPDAPDPCLCPCPGDMDGSNFIDGNDVQNFVRCLLGTAPQTIDCTCADLDGMSGPDTNDAPLFVDRLLGNPTCP